MGKAYTFLEPVGGQGALIAADRPAHGHRRRPLQPSFQATQVQRWSERLDHHVGSWLEAKAHRGESFPFLASLRPVLLDVVVDLMLGRSALAEDTAWKERLLGMMAYSTRPLGQQWLKLPFPGTAWARFRAARAEVDRRLEEAVRERVDHGPPAPGETSDLLDVILRMADAGVYEPSGREPLRAIRDEIMGLVSAGFETTSSAAAWTVAFAESENGTGTAFRQRLAELSPDALQDDPLVDAFLQETLRLRPPAPVLLRRARESTAVDGYHVPRGSRIALATWLLHRDPALHPQPHLFAPERFRDSKPDRWAYLPFGYGARHCIGGSMARTLLKRSAWWLYGKHDTVEVRNLSLQPVGMALRPARDPVLRLRPR
jgi:cytochrome P450